ncbi:MAG: hypothetical protein ABSF25_08690 [Bryobacteraceae bacterium]|jgi:hypothetical protein
MKPRHLTILFAVLAAALLPGVAHAQYSSCYEFACDSYAVYDPNANQISGYSRTVDYWWGGWYLYAESLLEDPNGETVDDVSAAGYSDAEADVSYAPGPSGGYEVDGVHSYQLEDDIAYDGDSYYDVWVPPPPVITSVTTDPQPWYSGNSYSINIYGSGFTDQPVIVGCSGIDQSQWTVYGTQISGVLNVSTLSAACTIGVIVDGFWVTAILLEPPTPPQLSCSPTGSPAGSPATLTRGSSITCRATGGIVTQWSFSGQSSDGTDFSVPGPSTGSSWLGTMVVGGTVSATVGGQTLSQAVTVTARPWFALVLMPPAEGSQAPMGSCGMNLLTSPPDPTEGSTNGVAQSVYCYGFTYNDTPVPAGGPNEGLYYVLAPLTDLSSYPWELNPGVTDPDDPFYQHQGGCFPTIDAIVAAAEAHEFGIATTSHYTEVRDYLAIPAQNPDPLSEALVRLSDGDIRKAIQAMYQAAHDAGNVEPPIGLPPNINYPPYRTCGQ